MNSLLNDSLLCRKHYFIAVSDFHQPSYFWEGRQSRGWWCEKCLSPRQNGIMVSCAPPREGLLNGELWIQGELLSQETSTKTELLQQLFWILGTWTCQEPWLRSSKATNQTKTKQVAAAHGVSRWGGQLKESPPQPSLAEQWLKRTRFG